jgi:hypothetical protein
MKWEAAKEPDGRETKYALASSCGRYSVDKYGSATGRMVYGAHRRKGHPLGAGMLAGNLPDALTAKLVCEDDDKS